MKLKSEGSKPMDATTLVLAAIAVVLLLRSHTYCVLVLDVV